MKKGAMFGLDARIALAIFGALSVISGASLYNAIQEANIAALEQDFKEIEKALTAYYLDTYNHLSFYSSSKVILRSGLLIENRNNFNNWKGPYLPYSMGETSDCIMYKQGSAPVCIRIGLYKKSEWASTNIYADDEGDKCDINSLDCAEYIQILPLNNISRSKENETHFKLLDSRIDNGDGRLIGKIRSTGADADSYKLYYQLNTRVRK